MKRQLISRIITLLLLSAVLALATHQYYYISWHNAGKEAFIAHQTSRYDRFISSPISVVPLLVGMFLITSVAVGVYELLTRGIDKLLAAFSRKVTIIPGVIRVPGSPPRQPWRLTTKIGCISGYFVAWLVLVMLVGYFYRGSDEGWIAVLWIFLGGLAIGIIIILYWVVAGLVRWLL